MAAHFPPFYYYLFYQSVTEGQERFCSTASLSIMIIVFITLPISTSSTSSSLRISQPSFFSYFTQPISCYGETIGKSNLPVATTTMTKTFDEEDTFRQVILTDFGMSKEIEESERSNSMCGTSRIYGSGNHSSCCKRIHLQG